MDLSFTGKTPTGEFVTGNGYYGDSKKAWIINVVPTSYGREIHKHEVEPDSVTYCDNAK